MVLDILSNIVITLKSLNLESNKVILYIYFIFLVKGSGFSLTFEVEGH